ncbi:MAG: sensor histidine kinase [Dermatophilaceae bacterium]
MSTVQTDDVVDARRTWTQMIHAGLRLVGVACCVANLLGGFGVALSLVDEAVASRVGLALVLSGQVAILVAIAGVRRSAWLTALALACSFTGAALALPHTTWATGASAWWPAQFVLTIVGYLVYVEPPGRRWWLVGLVIGANACARVATWPQGDAHHDTQLVPQLVYETSQAAIMAGTVYLTVTALLTAASRADAARVAARRQRQAEQAARAGVRRAREVDRFIHDEVLHALRTVAMDRAVVPAEQARQQAARLGRLMDGMPPTSPPDAGRECQDLTAMVEQLAAGSPLDVTVAGPRPVSVPPGVGQAFTRAVEESLRNAATHAGVRHARIRIRRHGLTVCVTVSDRGVGFEPGDVDASRSGLRDSIVQRMSDIGGSAAIRSSPGGGTAVALRWSPRLDGAPRPDEGIASRGIERLALAGVAAYLPFLLANPWYALWLAPLLVVPAAGWAGSLLAVGAGLTATAVGLERGLRGWHSGVLTVVAWVSSLANGLALPPHSTNTALYWLAGGVTAILYLQVLLRPLREAVLTGAGLTIIALACALRTLGDPSQLPVYLPALLSPALAMACAILLGRTVDAMGWEVLRSEEAQIEAAAARRLRADFEQRLHDRMDQRREAVLEFVHAIGEGRLDVADPAVQARAGDLERVLREQLMTQVPADVDLAVHRLAENGPVVRVRAAPQVPGPVADILVEALDSLAAAGPWPQDTDVRTIATRSGTGWRIAVMVTGPTTRLRGWAAALARDESWTASDVPDGVHLVRRLAQPSPSLADAP